MINYQMLKLRRYIQNYSKVVLYGAGVWAKEFLSYARKYDIKIEYIVVTDKKMNEERLENIPIYLLIEKSDELQSENILVLVAVSALYEEQIEGILSAYEQINYACLSMFDRRINGIGIKSENSKDENILMLADWYVENEGLHEEAVDEICEQISARLEETKNKKNIAFVIGDGSPRAIKIAKALLLKNYNITLLLLPGIGLRKVCAEGYRQLNAIRCDTLEEVVYRIIDSGCGLIHFFSNATTCKNCYNLIQIREILPPIVFDQYDILNEMYTDEYHPAHIKEWKVYERFCLENADAICNRGYEIPYLIKCGYAINGEVLHFNDYCENEKIIEKKKENEEEIHICYVGYWAVEECFKGTPFGCWDMLIEWCEKNCCHLHVYPSEWKEVEYKKYCELSSYNHYFHLHKPIPFNQLGEEIKEYDYGIMPMTADFRTREVIARNTREKMIYATTNKYFDYLDAGIPIIGATSLELVKDLNKYDIILEWTIEDYDIQIMREKCNDLKENVVLAQKELQMRNQIGRLIDFYESLY